jgi:hypothetical protein
MKWFEVDKAGLGKLLARKGKPFVLFELLQNALDEQTTAVGVTLERIAGTRRVRLIVEDNHPAGFSNLAHAFTLFAESDKKGDATKRGRFNLGEKLVLALCDDATIVSTKGGVRFDETGRHAMRAKRESGSLFSGVLKMTDEELAECHDAMQTVLVPAGVTVFYNGARMESREPVATVEATLATEVADDEGFMRRTTRKTTVEFFEPAPNEEATLYEMGIPVVVTGDRYHVNVGQKIPLNLDRDNVTPAYLARVRALAVEHLASRLTEEDANSTWLRDAVERHGDELPKDSITRVLDLRFGDKRVAYDPSDVEANSRAVAAGYVVVSGSQMSGAEWSAAKRVGGIAPAGHVVPTYKPYSAGGEPATFVDESTWTWAMRYMAHVVGLLARKLIDREVCVRFETGRLTSPWSANYGGACLTFNHDRLGRRWFEAGITEQSLDLILHEFGHEYESNHLSDGFADALTRLGARLAFLVARDEEVRGLLEVSSTTRTKRTT